ncbi:MAG TPA: hypothetical protein VNL71_00505, partial [Chloroflexota bacterium]|nr:hypothetical protein [Chloroflexota bacterium]
MRFPPRTLARRGRKRERTKRSGGGVRGESDGGAAGGVAAAAAVAGSVLGGRYQIEALLGNGCFSQVYRASDLAAGTGVAIRFCWVQRRSGRIEAEPNERRGRTMQCVQCGSHQLGKACRDREGHQRHRCSTCGRRQTERSASAFAGYRFPDDIIALAVRWYLRF